MIRLFFIILVFCLLLLASSFIFCLPRKNYKKDKPYKYSNNLDFAIAESNPDISIDNWDLHRNRLKKFGRSQYKGLTFFLSSENRIYYLSEQGDKVYC